MRPSERAAILRDIGTDLVSCVEWLPKAHRNINEFAGLGYPRQSYPDAEVAASGHSDPVSGFATATTEMPEKKFDRERVEADENLERAAKALHAVQSFILRHTIVAPRPPSGGLIDCANPRCDHFMTGLPNDRPRLGRCSRCYADIRKYREDWPLKRLVVITGRNTTP